MIPSISWISKESKHGADGECTTAVNQQVIGPRVDQRQTRTDLIGAIFGTAILEHALTDAGRCIDLRIIDSELTVKIKCWVQ